MRSSASDAMPRPAFVAILLFLSAAALTLVLAASAFGQEPNPPGGGPQN